VAVGGGTIGWSRVVAGGERVVSSVWVGVGRVRVSVQDSSELARTVTVVMISNEKSCSGETGKRWTMLVSYRRVEDFLVQDTTV